MCTHVPNFVEFLYVSRHISSSERIDIKKLFTRKQQRSDVSARKQEEEFNKIQSRDSMATLMERLHRHRVMPPVEKRNLGF